MRIPRLIRRLTDPLLERIPVPILGGVNRGRWWNLSSAGSGYATGRRGRAQMQLIAALLTPGDIVWDVGAHHGYVTLSAADRVGPRGEVHAFEPAPRNRKLLLRHLHWNGARNVEVHPYALSNVDGSATFGGTGTSKMQTLGAGSDEVQVRTAATLVQTGECPAPTFVKLDVEGAEADALEAALAILPPHARLLIAMHTREADQRCTALLHGAGYSLLPSRALLHSRAGRWHGDPDLYATGPAHDVADREQRLLQAHDF